MVVGLPDGGTVVVRVSAVARILGAGVAGVVDRTSLTTRWPTGIDPEPVAHQTSLRAATATPALAGTQPPIRRPLVVPRLDSSWGVDARLQYNQAWGRAYPCRAVRCARLLEDV